MNADHSPPQQELSGSNLLVLLGCFVANLVNIATFFSGSFTTFMKPISEETGWTRGEVALGFSVATGSLLLMLPFVGRLSDRVGPRRVLLLGGPLFGLLLASLGLIPPSYPVFLLCCVLLGVAGSTSYSSLLFALIPHFFNRRLGLALGIASSGTGAGLFLAPLLSQSLIASVGWHASYVVLGTISALVFGLSALFLLRDSPSQNAHARSGVGAQELRGLRFWGIAASYFLTGMAISGVVVHLVPLRTDRGVTAMSAARLASYLGLAALVSRIISGFLLDIVDAGLLGAGSFVLATAGMILLSLPLDERIALLGILMVGCALGAEGGILSYVTRRVFGIQAYGTLIGSMLSVFLSGVLVGPLISGVIYDRTAGYDLALYAFAACSLLAAIMHAPITLRSKPI